MIKLMKSKKYLFLFCGLLLAFLFLAKTPSLAQAPTVCPSKPYNLVTDVDDTLWFIAGLQHTNDYFTAVIRKTSGASPATGKCYSEWEADALPNYFSMYTLQMFCGCNNVGFRAYNSAPGCPDAESDEVKVNFGGCPCAAADLNNDNVINAIDESVYDLLYESCQGCTPWTCSWLMCGKIDFRRNGKIDSADKSFMTSDCRGSSFCWCGTRPPNDAPAYVCEGRYFGQPQCKTGAVPRPQGACVLDPKWGKIDPKNPTSSTNTWKWTYCYPKGQIPVSISPAPTSSAQKVCEGTYFGQSQCKAKVTPKPGYSCQLNSALGTVNLSQLSDPINYWKWSYCKN